MENNALTHKPAKRCKYKYCGKPFFPARTNQDFCSPQHKKEENNRLAKEERDILKDINRQLKQNFRILKRTYSREGTKVSYDELRSEGFDHTYHTSKAADHYGNFIIPVYYLFMLIPQGNNMFLIQKI